MSALPRTTDLNLAFSAVLPLLVAGGAFAFRGAPSSINTGVLVAWAITYVFSATVCFFAMKAIDLRILRDSPVLDVRVSKTIDSSTTALVFSFAALWLLTGTVQASFQLLLSLTSLALMLLIAFDSRKVGTLLFLISSALFAFQGPGLWQLIALVGTTAALLFVLASEGRTVLSISILLGITLVLFVDPATGTFRSHALLLVGWLLLGYVACMVGISQYQRALARIEADQHVEKRMAENSAEVSALLHDSINRTLTAIALKATNIRLQPDLSPAAAKKIDRIIDLSRSGTEQVVGLQRQLRDPQTLTSHVLPFPESLSQQIEWLQTEGFVVHYSSPESSLQLTPRSSAVVSSVVQEVLFNAYKYAQSASAITIAMSSDPQGITRIEVTNSINATPHSTHSISSSKQGLLSANALIATIGGSIRSLPIEEDQWTCTIEFPTNMGV